MAKTFPKSKLAADSQPWARSLEDRIAALEQQVQAAASGDAYRDTQLSNKLNLSGGNLTGSISFANSKALTLGEKAIDLNNSDIIGANNIYFDDYAGSSTEGIQWVRSTGLTYDAMYVQNGRLFFDEHNLGEAGLGEYGAPFRSAVGTATATLVSGSPWSAADGAITFPTGRFTFAPYVILTAATNSGLATVAHIRTVDTSGATFRLNYYGASSSTLTVRWVAFQMATDSTQG